MGTRRQRLPLPPRRPASTVSYMPHDPIGLPPHPLKLSPSPRPGRQVGRRDEALPGRAGAYLSWKVSGLSFRRAASSAPALTSTPKEWPEETYSPWAHRPGYIVSQDIEKEVYWKYKRRELKIFKLEDVLQ